VQEGAMPFAIDIARRWRAVFFSQCHGYAKFGKNREPFENTTVMQQELSKR